MTVIRWVACAWMTTVWAIKSAIVKATNWLLWDGWGPDTPVRGELVRQPELTTGAETWGHTLVDITADLAATQEIEVGKVAGAPVLLDDTTEFKIVFVSLERRTPKPRRMVHDELGAWDPRELDLMDAPLFREVAVETMAGWGPCMPASQRPFAVEGIADRVLCGV